MSACRTILEQLQDRADWEGLRWRNPNLALLRQTAEEWCERHNRSVPPGRALAVVDRMVRFGRVVEDRGQYRIGDDRIRWRGDELVTETMSRGLVAGRPVVLAVRREAATPEALDRLAVALMIHDYAQAIAHVGAIDPNRY